MCFRNITWALPIGTVVIGSLLLFLGQVRDPPPKQKRNGDAAADADDAD